MDFSGLAKYFRKLENTASRLTMTEILADLFRHCRQEEIGKICYLLQGRVVPLYEAVEFGIADKFMIRAIAAATDTDPDEVNREFKRSGDLGETAERMKQGLSHKGQGTERNSITKIYQDLYDIALTTGEGSQERKINKLAGILSGVDSLSARYIVRIPLDKLRLGFSDMTILDGLSWMLTGDKSLREKLEEAYNIRPDIGYLAQQIKAYGIKGISHIKAKVGVPILASLCQRLPTADEMIEKMVKVAVEPKYDGVRVQIHYQRADGRGQGVESKVGFNQIGVRSFSRNLENTTQMFPELELIYKQLDTAEVILDSEAVGVDPKTGKILPFQETTTRKRKHNIGLFSAQVPLRFYVFDILYKDGADLLATPLSERRKILEKTIGKGDILAISPQIVTDQADKLRQYHDQQLKNGLEGAVVKKWESPYVPGRRNFSWVKFKEEEGKTGKLADTIDAVVMGYYKGEGKRSGFGIGALLVGVRHGEDFVTVTKIGTGVSDELWKELYRQLDKLIVNKPPKQYKNVYKTLIPDVWIAPELAVEVAGDDLTRSPTHGAGYAIRFPRLVKIRRDKGPSDATSTAEVKKMYENQLNAN